MSAVIMDKLPSVGLLPFLAIVSSIIGIAYAQDGTYNVFDFGATGNGQVDDSPAFLKAWQKVCGAVGGTQTLNIPMGRIYLVKPIKYEGPCKSNSIVVQIRGHIVAPSNPNEWTGCELGCLLCFQNVKGLVVKGTGLIDGKGSRWWTPKPQLPDYTNNQETNLNCVAPAALSFHYCDRLQLSGFNSRDSPNKHIYIHGSTGVSISNIHVIAPEHSPNTDGIVLSATRRVNIFDSVIATGDDCIAIKGGSSFINVTRVTCGPGHGISVGSLGRRPDETVEQVHVQNCTFYKTQNGARIKTFQGGSGYAKAISFNQITLVESKNPIIIDQHYVGTESTDDNGVQVSDITFSGFHGTSATEKAIILNCSDGLGCTNIVMDHVNLTSIVQGKPSISFCKNASGRSSFTRPNVPCLSK